VIHELEQHCAEREAFETNTEAATLRSKGEELESARRILANASATGATHCNTLQHAAARCNTLQYAATHCNTLPRVSE